MGTGNSPPTMDEITELCEKEYGLTGPMEELGGENKNYLIKSKDGKRYVLKIADDVVTDEMLAFEAMVLEKIHTAGIGVEIPQVVPNQSGFDLVKFRIKDGSVIRARLHRFLPGIPWYKVGPLSPSHLYDLGILLAKLDVTLSQIEAPISHRTHPWDLSTASQHRTKVPLVKDPDRRRILEWMFHFYAASAKPNLVDLPHSVIHGDVNDENLLLQDNQITGLLDFGDCLHNPTICELAVTLAYAMLDQENPLEVGAQIVRSYHGVRPLSVDELTVLYPLICGRLCTTVSVAAERRQLNPDHPSWFVTEERAWRLLELLIELDPVDAGNRLTSGLDFKLHTRFGDALNVLLAKRDQLISTTLSLAYHDPIKMVRGSGQYLYDDRGHPFLDLVNNVCHVGHCHPRVVEAGQGQMARLNTNTRYLYDELTQYAERLCATLPDTLNTCFIVNSGSEANELALRLARTHTGRADMLVVEGAYHGSTGTLIHLSPYKFMGKGGTGTPEKWVHVVPVPDGYRGLYKGKDRATGLSYGDEVGRVITEAGVPIAGFIVESLLSCAGQIIPPDGYLERAFQHVRKAGGVCIVDEVQVGFGRVGTHFWGFELQDITPDIVVIGKPIGNGHPMGAVITTGEIAESFNNGMEFFSTFGGNPVSCAIGLAVLDVIRDEGLQEHALELGTRLRAGLEDLLSEHPLIGEVRGRGLFIGIELVRDRTTLEPATEEANLLVNRLKKQGMLLSTDGPYHNVIKIKPPMVLNEDDVDMVLRSFATELNAMGY